MSGGEEGVKGAIRLQSKIKRRRGTWTISHGFTSLVVVDVVRNPMCRLIRLKVVGFIIQVILYPMRFVANSTHSHVKVQSNSSGYFVHLTTQPSNFLTTRRFGWQARDYSAREINNTRYSTS